MTDLVAAVLFIGLILFIGYPLLREAGAGRRDTAPESQLRHLCIVRDEVLASLKDAELEFHMGKISEADYQQTKADLEPQAMEVLKQIDEVQAKISAKRRGRAAEPVS